MVRTRLQFAIALLSASVVAYQLQLMHFLSLVQWHHFAFMVISVALLAYGAGGTLLVLFRTWFEKHSDHLLPGFTIFTAFLMSIVIRLSRLSIFNFDSYRLFVENEQYLNLLINYLLFFLPFLSGSLVIGMVYMIYTRHTGKYYFADLIGAGAGGPLAILLFRFFSPSQISPLIAFLPLLAAILILKKNNRLLFLFSILLISAGNIFLFNRKPDLNQSQYKDITKTLLLPEVTVREEKNSPFGYLTVLSSPAMRYAPGLSVNFRERVPNCKTIFNNGNWYDAILPENTTSGKGHIFDYTSMGVAYVFNDIRRVLVLGSGSGNEISQAVKNDATHITGIEPDPELIRIMKDQFDEYTGNLFKKKQVRVINTEPRTFLSRDTGEYDLIIIPLLGSFGGSIGLQAMQEENLLTIEAFREMWGRLSEKGMIMVSCWLDYPVRYAYKTAATLAECLAKEGIKDPAGHVVAVQSWGTISFCVNKSPFTQSQMDSLEAFAGSMSFETLLTGKSPEPDEILFAEEQLRIDSVINVLFTSNRNEIYSDYTFKIRPATDNKPYFSQFLKWKSFFSYRDRMAEGTAAFMELGYMIIVVTFLQLILLSLLFIILPLFRLGWRGGKKGWVFSYFGALGLGFMFIEMVFIRYFTLYLGHPVYATAFVLSVLLIFSGAGSLVSSRFTASKKSIIIITFITSSLLLISMPAMEWFIEAGIGFNLMWRVLTASVFIALPSFFMGMGFPLGLRMLDEINKAAVPWAWGINACLSVISTALATIIAVEGGFRMVLLIAVLSYFLAGLVSFRKI